jgi:hypothetical protein
MRPNVFLALVFLSLPIAAACRLPLASKTLMNGVAAALRLDPGNMVIKDKYERFKARLFPVLFGAPTIEDRTLLLR